MDSEFIAGVTKSNGCAYSLNCVHEPYQRDTLRGGIAGFDWPVNNLVTRKGFRTLLADSKSG